MPKCAGARRRFSEKRSPQGLDVALLDPLDQHGDALDGVVASAVGIDTAELVVVQAAKGKGGVSMGPDAKAIIWGVVANREAMVLAGCAKGVVPAAHLSSRREVAAGSMRLSSSAPMTPKALMVEV